MDTTYEPLSLTNKTSRQVGCETMEMEAKMKMNGSGKTVGNPNSNSKPIGYTEYVLQLPKTNKPYAFVSTLPDEQLQALTGLELLSIQWGYAHCPYAEYTWMVETATHLIIIDSGRINYTDDLQDAPTTETWQAGVVHYLRQYGAQSRINDLTDWLIRLRKVDGQRHIYASPLSYNGVAILKAKNVKVGASVAISADNLPSGSVPIFDRNVDRPRINYVSAGVAMASIAGDERLELEWGGLEGNEPFFQYVISIVQPERELVIDMGRALLTPNRKQIREHETVPNGLFAKLTPKQQQQMLDALMTLQPVPACNDFILTAPGGAHFLGASIADLLAGKDVDGSNLEKIRAVVPQ